MTLLQLSSFFDLIHLNFCMLFAFNHPILNVIFMIYNKWQCGRKVMDK